MTLQGLQSAANFQNSAAPMTWRALNAIGQSTGARTIDYARFAARWARFAARWGTDPVLKQLVDRFDANGLVIKTNTRIANPAVGQKEKSSEISSMAMRQAKKAF